MTSAPEVDASSSTAGPSNEQGSTVLQLASDLDILNLRPLLREGLPDVEPERIGNVDIVRERHAIRTIVLDSVNQLRHSAESIRTSVKSGTRSVISSKAFSSITRSKGLYYLISCVETCSYNTSTASKVPEPLQIVKVAANLYLAQTDFLISLHL